MTFSNLVVKIKLKQLGQICSIHTSYKWNRYLFFNIIFNDGNLLFLLRDVNNSKTFCLEHNNFSNCSEKGKKYHLNYLTNLLEFAIVS